MNDIALILNEVNAIRKKYENIALLTGENFNLFDIIGLKTSEVRLHSSFLAELLDSKGSHGQGEKFLLLFIEQLRKPKEKNDESEKTEKIVTEFDCSSSQTWVEYPVSKISDDGENGGRIDILIEDSKKKHIIIENKIYASDQPKQLKRYKNFDPNAILLYLNLFGDEPDKNSIIDLETNKDYYVISYEKQILNWLSDCMKEAATLPFIRETIHQYINLIKQLTNQSILSAMSNEIIDVLTKNPENLKSSKELSDHFSLAKAKILWNFWEALQESLQEHKLELEEIPRTVTKEKTINCFKNNFRDSSIYFGLYSTVLNPKDDVVIRWGCELGLNIYVGFFIREKIENELELAQYEKIINNYDKKYQSKQPWIGWQYTEPQLNFYEFKSEAIYDLADKDKLKDTVQKIAGKAQDDIENIKKLLSDIN